MAITPNIWRANSPGMSMPASGGINFTGDSIYCALYTSSWGGASLLDYQLGYTASIAGNATSGTLTITGSPLSCTATPVGVSTTVTITTVSTAGNIIVNVPPGCYGTCFAGTGTTVTAGSTLVGNTNGASLTANTVSITTTTGTQTVTVNLYTGEVVTASGYTVGGYLVGSKTNAYVAAASYAQQWTATSVYNTGDIVRPASANNHIYVAAVGGTSGSATPAWSAIRGSTLTDGGVTWVECGYGVQALNCAAPFWTVTAQIIFQYAVFYDNTATNPVAKPFIGIQNYGSSQTGPGGGTLSLPMDVNGLFTAAMY
jgi:hypothetical protein